ARRPAPEAPSSGSARRAGAAPAAPAEPLSLPIEEILPMPRPSLLGLACATALAAGPSLAASPVFTDLGAEHFVQAVSDDGPVVVGVRVRYDADPADNGVTRWTATGGTRLIGGLASGRPDVSADGRTIGATVMADRPIAAFWTEAGGWKTLAEQNMIPPLPGW